jgi:hypothetical protein
MDFKAWNEINRAHDRLDTLESIALKGSPEVSEFRAEFEKFQKLVKDEIQGLKMRAGKMKEIA